MSETIKTLTIEGFKSIRKLENFELRALNVLIGANGAGKSNFVSFFRLLREMIEQRLQEAVRKTEGGADGCLFMGPKLTPSFTAKLRFGRNGYEFALAPTTDNGFVFTNETAVFYGDIVREDRTSFGSGHMEARLKDYKDSRGSGRAYHAPPHYVFDAISNWVVYHFHDTSITAGVRRPRPINDDEKLRPDADNLAAFLFRVQRTHRVAYDRIRDVVRLAAPFFDDFKLRPTVADPNMIQLEWTQKNSDYPFRAIQLSDGTLRFICLATALLQPDRPATVLFDEPELGLHPYALTLLAGLLRKCGEKAGDAFGKQVIVSTQAEALLNEFEPEDVIVVERVRGDSTFRRLDREHLSEWLREYSLGELWRKNVLGGRPQSDDTPAFVHAGDTAS